MFTNLLLSRHNFLFSIRWKDCYIYIRKYSYAEIQSRTLTAIDIIVTNIPFNRAGSKVIFIDVINLDRDLDQPQVAISHSKNSSRSETIQLFDKNHFYFWSIRQQRQNCWIAWLEREELGQTNLNNILAIPHPMSLIAFKSVVPVAAILNGIDWETVTLGIRLPILDCEGRLCEHRIYLYDLLLELMDQEQGNRNTFLVTITFEYLSNFRHEEL